jgi:hypothetical protein
MQTGQLEDIVNVIIKKKLCDCLFSQHLAPE